MKPAWKAWFWMLDYAYSVTDEVRALTRPVDPGSWLEAAEAASAFDVGKTESQARETRSGSAFDDAQPDQRPVILLPGIFETYAALRHVGAEVHRLGHPVHVVPQLGRTVATIDAVARHVRQYIDDQQVRHVLLLAHSKGGLVGKYLMLRLDAHQSIDGLIAINSPFAGSQWGRYLPVPSVRALAPDDLTVRFLGAPSVVDSRIVSVYSRFDQNVHAGSRLAGARNVRLGVSGHSRILRSRSLLRLLPEAISWLPPRAEPMPRVEPVPLV